MFDIDSTRHQYWKKLSTAPKFGLAIDAISVTVQTVCINTAMILPLKTYFRTAGDNGVCKGIEEQETISTMSTDVP